MSGLLAFTEKSSVLRSFNLPTPKPGSKRVVRTAVLAACSVMVAMTAGAQTGSYVQTNIIANTQGTAPLTDSTLVNPWGVALSPSALWIDKANSGSVAVDNAAGALVLPSVTIPAGGAAASPYGGTSQGSPSGTVYNGGGGFNLPGTAISSLFLFGTLDGTIAAWGASSGTNAVTAVDNSAAGASYTGIALDTNASGGPVLLAADFAKGTVDVFSSSFATATLAGSFADPALPAGYSPFGIHSIGTEIYVTYAEKNNGAQVVGPGLGFVDVFDSNGNLLHGEAISQGALNAPWGMALAPAGFGQFGGDLLVGNFGDGVINAYNPTTFAFVGSIQSATGTTLTSIANPGLWEIFFGQGGALGDPNTLYFVSGGANEQSGLFGSIAAAVVAGAPTFSLNTTSTSLTVTGGQVGTLNLTLTGSNGFSGPVTFTCSGLPTGDSCAPLTVTLSGTTPTPVMLSIATVAPPPPPPSGGGYLRSAVRNFGSHGGATLAFIAPLGLLAFAGVRRRRTILRGLLSLFVLGLVAMTATGCSSSSTPQAATAAPATAQFTVTATGAGVSQSVLVTLTTM
jgi:uncharacterized protein (TIGR03118 family)